MTEVEVGQRWKLGGLELRIHELRPVGGGITVVADVSTPEGRYNVRAGKRLDFPRSVLLSNGSLLSQEGKEDGTDE